MPKLHLLFSLISFVAGYNIPSQLACSSDAIPSPKLPGIHINQLLVSPVHNFSIFTPQNGAGPSFNTTWNGLDFCNITVTYTHAGHKAPIGVTVWLPLKGWNGRFQGTGGAGFVTGLGATGLAPAVGLGYAAAETNGGHAETYDPPSWALDRQRHVNRYLVEVFASIALNDLALIGKAITTSFYRQRPKYSYWNGCSTGGRQGLMLAQRYPHAFDGIVANSPAIYWPELTVATFWPQLVMNRLGMYPEECELEFITQKAIEACDELDGLKDGIVSLPGECHFDAVTLVGQPLYCQNKGEKRTLSLSAAVIANEAWRGASSPSGEKLWYGLNRGAPLTYHAATSCSNNGTNCHGIPFPVGTQQLLYPVLKDPTFNLTNLSYQNYTSAFHASVKEYASLLSTTNPDLSAFAGRGGKMITTHGLADPQIFPNGTVEYYERVMQLDPNAKEYYRFFEAPGVGHCVGGVGFYPKDTLGAVVRWVENGKVPETLVGVKGGKKRELCPWPKRQVYVKKRGRFECVL